MTERIDKRLIYFLCFLILAVLGQACAKNTLTSSWVDQSFKGPIKGRILVVGVFKDSTTHKIFEDSFVASLIKSGADAVPSYSYAEGTDRHSKKWLSQIVKESEADAILITHVSSENKQTVKVAPHGLILGGGTYGNSFDGYHSYAVELTLEEGYTVNRTEEFIDASLFDSQHDKLIWSASSKSVNLNHFLRKDDEQLENLFIKDMKRDHIL